eukprot:PhF_6_TR13591/c1_g2_i5/m.21745
MIIPLFISAIWALGGVSADCASETNNFTCNQLNYCIWNFSASKSNPPPCRQRCSVYRDSWSCLQNSECMYNKTYSGYEACLEYNALLCEQIDSKDICVQGRNQGDNSPFTECAYINGRCQTVCETITNEDRCRRSTPNCKWYNNQCWNASQPYPFSINRTCDEMNSYTHAFSQTTFNDQVYSSYVTRILSTRWCSLQIGCGRGDYGNCIHICLASMYYFFACNTNADFCQWNYRLDKCDISQGNTSCDYTNRKISIRSRQTIPLSSSRFPEPKRDDCPVIMACSDERFDKYLSILSFTVAFGTNITLTSNESISFSSPNAGLMQRS